MKFLELPNFKLVMYAIQGMTFLMVLNISCNTCSLSNDMKTTKKATKTLNENIVTKEDLDEQTEKNLILEKELDKVKTGDVKEYLKTKKDTFK